MSDWLDERVHRLESSVERLKKAMALELESDPTVKWVNPWFLRNESSICLRRAIALWWGLRWGRK